MSAAASTAPRQSTQSKLRRATVVTVAVLSVGALVGCGSDSRSAARSSHDRAAATSYGTTFDTPTSGEVGNYPAFAKHSFVDGCSESGSTSRWTCKCIIDKFEQKLPLDKFLHQSIKAYRDHELPDGWLDTIAQCMHGVPAGSGDSNTI